MCATAFHDALKEDDVEWSALPAIRPWHTAPGEDYLQRNCTICNSTLARLMPPQGDDDE